MRLLAALAGALVLAAPAAAGGSSVKIPAPAAGKIRIEMVTFKASAMPKLTVTNLAALGSGFHGTVLIGKSSKKPGTYVAVFAMFSGSGSAPTAGTVNLQASNATPVGKPSDVSAKCSVLRAILTDNEQFGVIGDAIAYKPLTKSDSPPPTEFKNDVEYQAKSVPCT